MLMLRGVGSRVPQHGCRCSAGLTSCGPTGEAALKDRAEQEHQACEAAQSALPAQKRAER